jgi:hypothetical protein
MYDILSLTNSTLLTADMILLWTKILYLIHDSHSPFCRKMCVLLLVWSHRPPVRPPARPQNLTYILIVFLVLSLVNHVRWVPVTPTWHILGLWMEGQAPAMEVAANTLNKRPRRDNMGCSSSMGVGRRANNSYHKKINMLQFTRA